MHVVLRADAPTYAAPGHEGMRMIRLQGMEAGPSDTVWVGLSEIEPGGGTSAAAASVEKFYIVLDGELEVHASGVQGANAARLGRLDSCHIAPGESRRLVIRGAMRGPAHGAQQRWIEVSK
jgi:hypothetical protein